ncbi:MAG: hypothetical protein ACREUG_14280, partial [Steroidobacteraceae bacterium]
MYSLSRRRFVRGGLNVLGAACAVRGLAPLDALAADAGTRPITVTPLTPRDRGGLTLLQGAGCNVVALPGPDGALMIDGGLAADSRALLEAVTRATGTRRVATLINTHWHPEQTGS